MRRKVFFPLVATGTILILCMAGGIAQTADYPNKPITLISPFSPGGMIDAIIRPFAALAEKRLGVPMIMVNKPGATTMIGGSAAAEARPDGYTLLCTSSAMPLAILWEIAQGRKTTFTLDDFTPLGCLGLSPGVVLVSTNSPWKTVDDLVKDCKARPSHYAFCSGGLYGNSHMAVEVFMDAIGINGRHLPYKGGGECLSSLVGQHVDFNCQFPGTSISLVRGKKLRALALQDEKRLESLPDIPCVKELGLAAVFYSWFAILVRKETPMAIVTKLKEVVKEVAVEKAFIDAIELTGDKVYYLPGEELAKYWIVEAEKVNKIFEKLRKVGKPQ